jgi:hypothetical protein
LINTDRPRFLSALTALGATLGRTIDEATLEGYWAALRDLDIEQVEAGAAECMRTAVHFPRPVEIRNCVGATVEDKATEAWGVVCHLARNCRAAKHPDPIAEEAVQKIGGWQRLGAMKSDDLHAWGRRDFLDVYRAAAKERRRQELTAKAEQKRLPGKKPEDLR